MSGAVAGPSVDIALYPLDTIKTRLQAPGGFIKAGGFRGVYNGLGIAALGSAPGSMFFFSTYEGTKGVIGTTCAYIGLYGVLLVTGLLCPAIGAPRAPFA